MKDDESVIGNKTKTRRGQPRVPENGSNTLSKIPSQEKSIDEFPQLSHKIKDTYERALTSRKPKNQPLAAISISNDANISLIAAH